MADLPYTESDLPVSIVGDDASGIIANVTATGALKVDNSAVTQPVSGTVTANQGTAAASTAGWPITGGTIAESTAAWTSATGLNTSVTMTVTGYTSVLVTLNQGTTITGGVVTFEISDTAAFTNAYPVNASMVNDPDFSATYTLVASTNQAFYVNVRGAAAFRVRLSTVISGTGTVNVGIQANSLPGDPVISGTVNAENYDASGNGITSTLTNGKQFLDVNAFTGAGVVSIGNSTTTPLGSNGVFTGTFENVKDYSYISLIIFADQASAANGLVMQWSPDGVNVDRTEPSNLTSSSGRAFAMQVRAQYFRVVYTNGAVAQGVFRLNTTYHVTGTGLITRPITTAVSTDNFSLLTISATAGVSGTNILPITTTAVSTSQALDVDISASADGVAALANQVFTTSYAFNLPTSGTESLVVYLKNPNASGKTLVIKRIHVAPITATNAMTEVRVYSNPTTSANGTSQTATTTSIGSGAAAVATPFSGPTASANGAQLLGFSVTSAADGSVNNHINIDGLIRIAANNSLLITGTPTSNNFNMVWTVIWQEV